MTTRIILLLLIVLSGCNTFAQDTFSIVAIDSLTGEIGSAGASCVGSSATYPHGAAILSDVIPGIGVIHTQAAWSPTNQQHAHDWMIQGLSPQNIIDSLVAYDANNTPATRQYGIADYHGGSPRSAAYTGISCSDYKNDTAHIYYSIQGNILQGQNILDSMQSHFLNTVGTLADRLMSALQGAKVVGADTRCAIHNTSSQSAFLRVARLTDPADSLHLDLWMAYPQNLTGIFPVDPIDSLQTLYNIWKSTVSTKDDRNPQHSGILVFTEATGKTVFDFTRTRDYLNRQLYIFDLMGRILYETTVNGRIMKADLSGFSSPQIMGYRLLTPGHPVAASGTFIHSR
ncbi:MAG: DUF1028 domain-containing protein [Bacteroidota bacterium]